MTAFRIRTFDPASAATVDVDLPLAAVGDCCRVSLTPVWGASELQVFVIGSLVSVRVEARVSADFRSPIDIDITWLEESKLEFSEGPERRLLFLPADSRYEPAVPLRGTPPGAALDLLFLIDATCNAPHSDGVNIVKRLSEPGARGLWDALTRVTRDLATAYPDLHCGFLAFSDTDLTGRAAASDLVSAQVFQPAAANGLMPYLDPVKLDGALRALRPASGNDWVDGLAEAMARARDHAGWRPSARKLLIVVGDSPGHSVCRPEPAGCDAHPRTASVEDESDRLHRGGVEIASIYLPLQDALRLYAAPNAAEVVGHVREQYRELASVSWWHWDVEGFEHEAAAALSAPPRWIARGPAYGHTPVVQRLKR